MGAKLAKPDKLCINVWGDAAIGFTGMDFETAVRERIPIMSILLNNFSMAIELKVMPISTEKYRSTDISGDYAAMARAFGGYGERVTKPDDIIPAIKRGIAEDQEGQAGAAGVHHQQGDRGLKAGDLRYIIRFGRPLLRHLRRRRRARQRLLLHQHHQSVAPPSARPRRRTRSGTP